MSEIHPRIRRIRRFGVLVFLALTVASIPIGIHIKATRAQPELWLTLLGAVLIMVLISLFALETAAAPIPEIRPLPQVREVPVEAVTESTEVQSTMAPESRPSDLAEQATELDPIRGRLAPSNPDSPILVPGPVLVHPRIEPDPE
jgi:hypothetical protein